MKLKWKYDRVVGLPELFKLLEKEELSPNDFKLFLECTQGEGMKKLPVYGVYYAKPVE